MEGPMGKNMVCMGLGVGALEWVISIWGGMRCTGSLYLSHGICIHAHQGMIASVTASVTVIPRVIIVSHRHPSSSHHRLSPIAILVWTRGSRRARGGMPGRSPAKLAREHVLARLRLPIKAALGLGGHGQSCKAVELRCTTAARAVARWLRPEAFTQLAEDGDMPECVTDAVLLEAYHGRPLPGEAPVEPPAADPAAAVAAAEAAQTAKHLNDRAAEIIEQQVT